MSTSFLRPPVAPVGPASTGPSGPAGRGPRPTGPGGGREPRAPASHGPAAANGALLRRVLHFATLLLEVEAGLRDPRHLVPLTTPSLGARLARRPVRAGTAGSIERVLTSRTARRRFDAVVVVRQGQRRTALAIGLRRTGRAWCVDQAARPEDQADHCPDNVRSGSHNLAEGSVLL